MSVDVNRVVTPATPSALPSKPYTPVGTITTPASRHYDVSPMVTKSLGSTSASAGVISVSKKTPTKRDALQALELVQFPDCWIDNLQRLLGNHLFRLAQR